MAEKLRIDNSKKTKNKKKKKNIFATFGVPQLIISDNGPKYKSEKFKQFAKDLDFKHIITSPNYPQANGLTGRNI